MTASNPTTEQQFFAEYDRMKIDLAHARQEILLLSNQLREANTEQEKLSYKCDFLTSEIARVTASREQYERVAIRVTGMIDGQLDALIAVSEKLKTEIRDAAFTKVPGTQTVKELAPPAETKTEALPDDEAALERIAKEFGAGFSEANGHAEALPAPRFGSGPH